VADCLTDLTGGVSSKLKLDGGGAASVPGRCGGRMQGNGSVLGGGVREGVGGAGGR